MAELEYLAFAHRRESVPCRLIVRRKRIDPGSLLDLSPEHRYEYSAFITNRSGGMVYLEADHRQRAEIEGYIKDLKYGVGLNHLPSANFNANAAWLAVQAMAHNLCRWLDAIGSSDQDADRESAAPPEQAAAPDPETIPHDPDQAPAARTRRRRPVTTTATFMRRIFTMPGRLSHSGRRYVLHAPRNWTWALQIEALLARLHVLPVPA